MITENDREVMAAYRRPMTLGRRVALLVVDVTYEFVGLEAEPILDSIKKFPHSCGEAGWQAIGHLQRLLAVARKGNIPIFYTIDEIRRLRSSNWGTRDRVGNSELLSDEELAHRQLMNSIVSEIEPGPADVVIEKRGASAFFGTSLIAWLRDLGIDTVLVTGTTTSGCVRATVVDASTNFGLQVGIVEECCFDRLDLSHRVSMMDMNLKYGLAMSLKEASDFIRSLDPSHVEDSEGLRQKR